MSWVVYILECADQSLYTGITTELSKRIEAHNKGRGAKYTKARCPVKLVYSEAAETKSAALKREYQIKQWTRAKKLELINASQTLSIRETK